MASLIPRRIIEAEVMTAREEAAALLTRAREEAQLIRDLAAKEAEAHRDEARAEGNRAAYAEAASILLNAEKSRQALLADAEGGLVKIALAAARHVIGETLQTDQSRMEARVRALVAGAKRATRARIRVAPLHAERLEALGTVIIDEELEPGDVIVETEGGRFDARIAVQLAALERAMTDAP